jgi:hypothetical protein
MWCIITDLEIGLTLWDSISLSWPRSETKIDKHIDKLLLYRLAYFFILDSLDTRGKEDTRCHPCIVSARKLIDVTFGNDIGDFIYISPIIFVSLILMMSNSTSPNLILARECPPQTQGIECLPGAVNWDARHG